MPLVAFRMVKDHGWIRQAIRARFPVLFVDEYQDLGHALHELVLLLCRRGIGTLTKMRTRCTSSRFARVPTCTLGVLKEPNIKHRGKAGSPVRGRRARSTWARIATIGASTTCPRGSSRSGRYVGEPELAGSRDRCHDLPNLLARHPPEEIAILYRAAWLGDKVAQALDARGYPHLRTDNNALVKRNSPAARFVEGCAIWATGGWRKADPPFSRLLRQALALFYGGRAQVAEEQALSLHLIAFLRSSIDSGETAHAWLARLYRDLVLPWRAVSRNPQQDWDACLDLVAKTDPATGKDMPLDTFAGRVEGTGRLNLSTLHSAKGREFDAVILYGMNSGDIQARETAHQRHPYARSAVCFMLVLHVLGKSFRSSTRMESTRLGLANCISAVRRHNVDDALGLACSLNDRADSPDCTPPPRRSTYGRNTISFVTWTTKL